MSDKELLYIEDVVNHLKHFKKLCETSAQTVQDPSLRSFLTEIANQMSGTNTQVSNLLTSTGGTYGR